MNYDSLNVHELISEAYSDGIDAGRFPDHLEEIESALRKAVIREASVGTREIYDPHTGKFYVAELVPNPEKLPFR